MKNSDTNINKYFEQAKEVQPVISESQARGFLNTDVTPASSPVKRITGKQVMSYLIPTASAAAAIVVMAVNGAFQTNPSAPAIPTAIKVKVESPAKEQNSLASLQTPQSVKANTPEIEEIDIIKLSDKPKSVALEPMEKPVKPTDVKGVTIMNLTRSEAEKLGMRFQNGSIKLAAFRNSKNPLMISLDKSNIAARFSPEANDINSITPKFISNTSGSKSFSLLKNTGFQQKEIYGDPRFNTVASHSNIQTDEGARIQTSMVTTRYNGSGTDNANNTTVSPNIDLSNLANFGSIFSASNFGEGSVISTVSVNTPNINVLANHIDSNGVSFASAVTITTDKNSDINQLNVLTLNSNGAATLRMDSSSQVVLLNSTEFNGADNKFKFINLPLFTSDMMQDANMKFNFDFKAMNEGFKQMDERSKKMDEDFKQMDERFKKMDENFNNANVQMDSMLKKFNINLDDEDSFVATTSVETTNFDNNNSVVILNQDNSALTLDKVTKINNLVAVGVSVNSDDVIDYVVWFEPGEEFVSKLPERYRDKLAPEIAEVKTNQNVCDANSVIKGEKYMDSWRACSGAIENLNIYPNPTKGAISVNFNLNQERLVAVSVHDLFGKRIYDLSPEESRPSGSFVQKYELKDLQPGMYLIVAQTDKGETAVQRFILE